MTAKTAASHIGSNIVLDATGLESELGEVADAYKPGDIVYESAPGIWTKAATNAGQLGRVAIVGFKARIDSTGARKGIDDAYAAGDSGIPMILKCKRAIVKVLDQNGSMLRGAFLALSGTAGSLTVFSSGRITGCLQQALADNDTYAMASFNGYT
jgi:hypothetical protein